MANGDLINIKHCKELALRFAKDNRKGCDFSRVSKQFLNDLNTLVRLRITGAVMKHPSVGKTITHLF